MQTNIYICVQNWNCSAGSNFCFLGHASPLSRFDCVLDVMECLVNEINLIMCFGATSCAHSN